MNKKLFSAVLASAVSLSVFTGGAYAAEKKDNYIERLAKPPTTPTKEYPIKTPRVVETI